MTCFLWWFPFLLVDKAGKLVPVLHACTIHGPSWLTDLMLNDLHARLPTQLLLFGNYTINDNSNHWTQHFNSLSMFQKEIVDKYLWIRCQILHPIPLQWGRDHTRGNTPLTLVLQVHPQMPAFQTHFHNLNILWCGFILHFSSWNWSTASHRNAFSEKRTNP